MLKLLRHGVLCFVTFGVISYADTSGDGANGSSSSGSGSALQTTSRPATRVSSIVPSYGERDLPEPHGKLHNRTRCRNNVLEPIG